MEKSKTSNIQLWRLIIKEVEARYLESKIRDYPSAFIRAGDTQSGASLLDGVHEKFETEFILGACNAGYKNFFIDIGANVGIMSMQVGHAFDYVWCYEPNTEVLPILEANVRQLTSPATICSFALGAENGTAVLEIPEKNIGGAFLRVSQNLYSDSDLARKEGKGDLKEVQRRTVEVKVRDADEALAELFESVERLSGRTSRGVVKIDVEGMEEFIVTKLIQALPLGVEVAIVFENWSHSFDPGRVERETQRKLQWGSVGFKHPLERLSSKWLKLIYLITHPLKRVHQGTFYPPQSLLGTVALWVK